MFQIGDTVQEKGTTNQYVVKAVDPNFEGAGEGIGFWVYESQSIEWFNASRFEKVSALWISPDSGLFRSLKGQAQQEGR